MRSRRARISMGSACILAVLSATAAVEAREQSEERASPTPASVTAGSFVIHVLGVRMALPTRYELSTVEAVPDKFIAFRSPARHLLARGPDGQVQRVPIGLVHFGSLELLPVNTMSPRTRAALGDADRSYMLQGVRFEVWHAKPGGALPIWHALLIRGDEYVYVSDTDADEFEGILESIRVLASLTAGEQGL